LSLLSLQSKGSRLYDEKGVEYLDTRNNVAHCGHAHPEIAQAIAQQAHLVNTNTRYLHPNLVLLAEKLVATMPHKDYKVFFVNSGSEANDLALRLARAYSNNTEIICFDHAYHGHTLGTLQVSPYKYKKGTEYPNQSPGPHIHCIPPPHAYLGPDRDRSTIGMTCISNLRAKCTSLADKGVQALIIESGMSVAGVHMMPPGFLHLCHKTIHSAGGLVILDEVQTGLGRMGSTFWAWQQSDALLMPDIVTLGKPLGNGMPIAAVIASGDVVEAFEECGVEYFNTFGGNPVCTAAALQVMTILERDKLQERALKVGQYLQRRLLQTQTRCDLIGEVRGCGLFWGVELVVDRTTFEPATAQASFVCSVLKSKYRVLTSLDGPGDNVVVIKPPMVFDEADVDMFVDALEAVLTKDMPAAGDVTQQTRTPT
jgi:ethanolamine-phosphate phospho-lyase